MNFRELIETTEVLIDLNKFTPNRRQNIIKYLKDTIVPYKLKLYKLYTTKSYAVEILTNVTR